MRHLEHGLLNDHLTANAFVDSWTISNPKSDKKDGYTFPSCNPIKRIDYILVRNNSFAKDYNLARMGKDQSSVSYSESVLSTFDGTISMTGDISVSSDQPAFNAADGSEINRSADLTTRLERRRRHHAASSAVVTSSVVVGQEPTEDTSKLIFFRLLFF